MTKYAWVASGKANRAMHEPLHPGPQHDGFGLDLLCVLLLHVMLLGIAMRLVGAPTAGASLAASQPFVVTP
jgi:hypothetical protein